MEQVRIIFAGSGEFGLPTLKQLIADGHKIVQIYSQPDRPAGRGMKLTPTPIAVYAIEKNLPLVRTADINIEVLPQADMMVVIAFGQKIGEAVVDHTRLKAINLHSSILPKFRGAAPINAAILAGEKVTGNSVIRLAPKMDAGAVLGQSEVKIGEIETAGELHDRLAADGAILVPRVIEQLATGQATEVEQDHAKATLAKKLSRERSRLDFHLPARELARQVLGMYPWPGCRVRLMDGDKEVAKLTLVRARPHDSLTDQPAKAGEIDSAGWVICDSGRLEILEMQPEGKKPMSLAAFKNGKPWNPGMWLDAI